MSKPLTEAQVRSIIRQEIFRNNNRSRFDGVTAVVEHYHDGIDSPRVNESNIAPGTKHNSNLNMAENETFRLKNIKGVKTLTFHGYAANNVGGVAATKRAKIDGTAVFGTCYRLQGNGTEISPDTSVPADSFTQGSSYVYIEQSTVDGNPNVATGTRVGTSSIHFAYAAPGGVEVAAARVVAVEQDAIVIKVELASGWQIFGSVILS